jgi:hypothetical protein
MRRSTSPHVIPSPFAVILIPDLSGEKNLRSSLAQGKIREESRSALGWVGKERSERDSLLRSE